MIVLQNISKYYYSESGVTQALRKINMEFSEREFVAITGESGSGKSTLLNIISGLDVFDDGEMYFRGEPTFQYDDRDWERYRRDRIGFVFQDYNLIGHYSVMDNIVSALMIQGLSRKQAQRKGIDYLEQVGLKEYAEQRASQLSSGQKQRLSIARALAKEPEVIVADEPTGNLDSETGIQIVQLLKKVSEEKLVIMVTHNYEQAEPYVTRRIRLHDGEVVNDISEGTEEQKNQEEAAEADREKEPGEGKRNHMLLFFAWKNICTQRARSLLYCSFLLLVAAVSFLFLGELYLNKDDRFTRKYNNEAYYHKDDTRLSVRYPDKREINEEDLKQIKGIKYVKKVDLCDYINDVNYYMEEGKDYEFVYADQIEGEEQDTVSFLEEDKFAMSSAVIDQSDLKAGHMPESRNEIVLYSDNEKDLDTEKTIYFSNPNLWGGGQYYYRTFTVAGLLKEKTEQVYFSPDYCYMLTSALWGGSVQLDFFYDPMIQVYYGELNLFPVIGEDLQGNEVRVSDNQSVPYMPLPQGGGLKLGKNEDVFPGQGRVSVFDSQKDEMNQIEVEITSDLSDNSGQIIELSESLFHKLFQEKYDQASVYITDYAKTDKVIHELNKMGYDAISTFQVGATTYVWDKVMQRLVTIGIALVVLISVFIFQLLLGSSLMKLKKNDYRVFRSMGMSVGSLCRLGYFEMGIYCLFALAVTGGLMLGLGAAGVGLIQDILNYYDWKGTVIFLLYNGLSMACMVGFFNRNIRRKVMA